MGEFLIENSLMSITFVNFIAPWYETKKASSKPLAYLQELIETRDN